MRIRIPAALERIRREGSKRPTGWKSRKISTFELWDNNQLDGRTAGSSPIAIPDDRGRKRDSDRGRRPHRPRPPLLRAGDVRRVDPPLRDGGEAQTGLGGAAH